MKQDREKLELLRGTLDLLILRTLLLGPAHGHQIAKHIQRSTDDVLQVEHGSLYPALHRLERKEWLASKWESGEEGKRGRRDRQFVGNDGGIRNKRNGPHRGEMVGYDRDRQQARGGQGMIAVLTARGYNERQACEHAAE